MKLIWSLAAVAALSTLNLKTASAVAGTSGKLYILDFGQTVVFPQGSDLPALTSGQVAEVVARIAGTPSLAGISTGVKLPTARLFKRPVAVAFLDVSGVDDQDLDSFSLLNHRLRESGVEEKEYPVTDSATSSVPDLRELIGKGVRTKFGEDPMVLCSPPSLSQCSAVLGYGDVNSLSFSSADDVTTFLKKELDQVKSLPQAADAFAPAFSESEQPDFYLQTINAISLLKASLGNKPLPKESLTDVDQVIATTLTELSERYSGRLVAFVLLRGQNLSPTQAANSFHRLLSTTATAAPTSASANSNATKDSTQPLIKPTISQISDYQIFLWSCVVFVLVIIVVVYGIATMDVGRDSLLYANFKADVSHYKTD